MIIVRPATAVARSALVLAALFVGLLAPGAVTPGNAAGGATYNVATTGANTPTCGTTSSPCGAIQYTINNRARPGDTINVASGVYTETLTITEDLTITGAGAGQTIVDGNGAGSVATVPGAYTVALNNLTLRNGSATAGGGLASTGGALTLSGATVANNTVTSDGGGVSVVSGTLTLTNSTVANNTATGYGGGIEAESSPVMLTASQVVNNTASYGDGGGIDIYNDDATSPGALTVTNSTIVSNTATAGYGGGINENDAPVTLMRNSTVNGNTGGAGGGGLDLLDTFDNSPGALTVDNSAIVSNTTTGFGGGIQAYSPVTVTNSRIVSNTAAGHGGGLDYSYDGAFAGTVSAASIVNSQVLSNTATAPTTTTFGLGGGLDVESGTTVTVTGSTLAGNTADYGGAILNDYSAPISGSNVVTGTTLILTNSVVVSNTATRNGGGVSNDGGQVQVTTSMVAGNAARYGGGLYNYDHFTGSIAVIGSGTIAVANSAIVSNTTTLDGGGVSNDVGSTLTMTNSTIAGNTAAGFGGGILTYSSTVALVNDTVAGNTSPNSGGGISIANTNSLSTTLTNSILALNNAPRGPDCNGAFTSGGYNVVGSTSGGCAPSGGMGDVTNRDPRLGPLRDNGGPTLTRALLPDSPAIDLVSPASCAGLTTDQRGFPRPFPVGGACDAGAYEYQPVVTGLSPTSGPAAGGTSVIITGVDLEGATGVSFGGVAATGVVADPSGRSVMATSPAHAAGPVDVQAAVMAGTGVVTSTATMSGAFTYVAAPPTNTAVPPTNTAVPPTNTSTAVPPTNTSTAVPPTNTSTAVPPTNTSVPPTRTNTAVPVTNTAVPPTWTNTAVPPTNTAVPPTRTNTAVPPIRTNTAVPPIRTNTPAPLTNRAVPPTNTGTAVPPIRTNTAVPATSTAVPATSTAVPPTGANTAVPPTDATQPTQPTQPEFVPLTRRFCVAGGVETGREHAALALLNTDSHPARVAVTLYFADGTTRTATRAVPPNAQRSYAVAGLTDARGSFGLCVAADRAVSGQLTLTRPGQDGDSLLGSPDLGRHWSLAEGYTGLTFHETVALLNPGATTATVSVHLLLSGGTGNRTVTEIVGAHSERVVGVNSLIGKKGTAVSIVADADRAILVERTLTFGKGDYGLTMREAAPAASTSWTFAEGSTAKPFETFLTVLNPQDSTARVTAAFFGRDGRRLGSKTLILASRSRATIKINDIVPGTSSVASVVTSDRAVVVERPEYLGSPNAGGVAGSDVFGRNGAARRWAVPGGLLAGGDSEFLLLYNPASRAIAVDLTFYNTAKGETVTRRVTVPAAARYTFDVSAYQRGTKKNPGPTLTASHGETLRSDGGFIVERSVLGPRHDALQASQGLAQ